MPVLTSKLFTEADSETVKKLEDCATGRPNEMVSHFTIGAKGEHIRRVQQALAAVQSAKPGFNIPDFAVNGEYDSATSKAVLAYKGARDIRNFADLVDDIVGIKTLRSLDEDSQSGPPKFNPPVPPRLKIPNVVLRPTRPPLPGHCVTDDACPLNSVFFIQLIAGVTFGEIAEGALLVFIIQDHENRLSCLYQLKALGIGTPGLPLTPSGNGKVIRFTTPEPVKITRFGSIGGIVGATAPINPFLPPVQSNTLNIASVLTFGWRRPSSILPDGFVFFRNFDMGPISIAGVSIHGGRFELLSTCNGARGADLTI